jgi:hypothetical protein
MTRSESFFGQNVKTNMYVQMHALTTIQQLQRYEIIFQKILASKQHVNMLVVEEAIILALMCYESCQWIKKQLAVPSVWSQADTCNGLLL